jgi:hypothetical protein
MPLVQFVTTMSLLSLLGCRFSTTEVPGSLHDVVVSIDIEQRTERQPGDRDPYEFTHVTAVLADRTGAAIEKPDVQVTMNGKPLAFVVGTGNYYDRHPRYTLPKDETGALQPNTAYEFAIIWIDGTTHLAGQVRTPAALTLSQVTVPDTHRSGTPLEIGWRNVTEPYELVAFHGFEYPDAAGNLVQESGSVNAGDVVRKAIGAPASASGRLTVPASYFAPDGTKRVASFGVEITRAAETPVPGPFASGSRIRATRTVAFRAEVVPSGRQ